MHTVATKSAAAQGNDVAYGCYGWLFYKPELDYVLDTIPASNVDKIAAFSRTLQQHGITLFVVPLPNKIEVYPDKFSIIPAPEPEQKQRNSFFHALDSAGVNIIDVLPEMKKARHTCRVFDPYETHWTPDGIEAAADVIAKRIDTALSSRNIMRNTHYTVCDTILSTWGDLLNKLKGDNPPTLYYLHVNRVKCPDGELFTDDKQSKVMILGDSFVDRCRWWNSNLGAQIAHRISYPTRTYCSLMANYAGPAMYDHLPRIFPQKGIVIWAFTSRVLRNELKNKL